MKKSKSSEETLKAIRRNTAYTNSRTLSLIYCVLLVGVIGLLVFIGTHDQANEMPTIERVAWMFGGILAGVAASACLYHYLFAHYDQADALLQVAKFQERSIRTRKDAVDLVDKIREEVSKDESGPTDLVEEEPAVNETDIAPKPSESGEDEPKSLVEQDQPAGDKKPTIWKETD
jgi:hypothetical protein